MNRKLVVQKYGGTSVGTIERIKHVAAHIAQTFNDGFDVIAVVSAMGDQTDDLLSLAGQLSGTPPRRELDMLLTSGERIATALVSIALNEAGVAALSLTGSQCGIVTDTVHGNARVKKVLGQRIASGLSERRVIVVAGFQGVSQETKEITTLGRGGTDLSAIAIAAALGAERCELYKDVDGVFSADPRLVPTARKLDYLSLEAMTILAWHGANVLHPRCAHIAAKYEIPLSIRNSFNLERAGSLVTNNPFETGKLDRPRSLRDDSSKKTEGAMNQSKTDQSKTVGLREGLEEPKVVGVTHKSKMLLYKLQVTEKRDHQSQTLPRASIGLLNAVRSWLWDAGEALLVQNTTRDDLGFGMTFSIPEVQGVAFNTFLNLQVSNLEKEGLAVKVNVDSCGIVSVIGSGFYQSPEIFDKTKPWQECSKYFEVKNNVLVFVLDQSLVEQAVRSLHDLLVQ